MTGREVGVALRIAFDRSGGLAGIVLRADLEVEALDAEPAGIAFRLWTGDLADALPPASDGEPSGPFGRPGMADGFTYLLRLDDGERAEQFAWPDRSVPDDVRPLLSALTRRAVPAPPL
ncbi:hypothetical protein GIS00_12580 [Nakamurella sp. YIM 132087]|uniref:Uncharacterized protein n=1 Tax=Nakamurella alba TaxID=2665158 RepID=A0A7K1FL03_9ACTN|nr:protealysin inhibitor emfourin [Nakamurella alba]MTD14776.1 hypothetical protein [Nakamurella alba]